LVRPQNTWRKIISGLKDTKTLNVIDSSRSIKCILKQTLYCPIHVNLIVQLKLNPEKRLVNALNFLDIILAYKIYLKVLVGKNLLQLSNTLEILERVYLIHFEVLV